jgi:uncharacterized glyoxalase superfamily protein PhnB
MAFTSSIFYKDPKAAHAWLEKAFGFELTMLIEGPEDDPTQVHSEMSYGDGLIFVGAEWADWVKSPSSLGGANTGRLTIQAPSDIDGHCNRARAAGAVIIQEPADQPYGARTYLAVDLEGHEWDFEILRDFSSEEMSRAGLKVEQAQVSEPPPGTFFPQAFYRDARASLTWLQKAFGFEPTMVIENTGGSIRAHLAYDGDLMAIGSEWTDAPSVRPTHKSPSSVGGANTQSLHVQLERDLDAHCERARAAGAVIAQEPEDQFYGDRTYRAVDPEGHVWSFAMHVRDVSREEAEQALGQKIEGWR